MEKEGESIPLSDEDKLKIEKIFSENNLEDFKIHNHYFRDKYTGVITKLPRHGIELNELKKIFDKKHSIKKGFKIKTSKGFLYTLCYKESEYIFVKIIYIFSEPLYIFSAMRIYRNLDKTINEKYNFSLNE